MPRPQILSRGAALIPLLLCLAAAGPAHGAGSAADAEDEPCCDRQRYDSGLWNLPPHLHLGDAVYLPKIYYSSLTGPGLGGDILHPFRLPGTGLGVRGADVRLKGRITWKRQLKAEARIRHHGDRDDWSSQLKGLYTSLPERFYGIGPATPSSAEEIFRPRRLLAYAEVYRRTPLRPLKLGLRYELEHDEFLAIESAGLLAADGYLEQSKTMLAGSGLLFDLDTRDRPYSPTTGLYYQGYLVWFDGALGSDHDFSNAHVDLRHYFGLGGGGVVAAQLFLFGANGDVPFWRLASLGGFVHSRGYVTGRYRDRFLLALQGEYRSRLWRRYGFTIFAGVADVADNQNRVKSVRMKPTLGAGLRYLLSPDRNLAARFDLSVGEEHVRLDLSLDEAF